MTTTPDPRDAWFGLGRHQLWTALAFLGWTALACWTVNHLRLTFLLPRVHPRNPLVLYAYHRLEEPPDVLVLGTSRVRLGFDGELLQTRLGELLGEPVSVHEVGLDGMRPWLLYDVVREEVARRPPRRALVLGIDEAAFRDVPFDPGHGFAFYGSARDLFEVGGVRLTPEERKALLLTPFRGLRVLWNVDWTLSPRTRELVGLQQRRSGEFGPEVDAELDLAVRQQLLQRRVRAGRAEGATRDPDWEPIARDPAGVWDGTDYLGFLKTLDLLEELPCEVVFVRTPLRPDYVASLGPELLAGYEERVVEEIERRGFRYADLNTEPYPRDMELFRDRGHLAPEGRRLASSLFVERVLAPLLSGSAAETEEP